MRMAMSGRRTLISNGSPNGITSKIAVMLLRWLRWSSSPSLLLSKNSRRELSAAAHFDQARLQERQMDQGDRSHQRLPRDLLERARFQLVRGDLTSPCPAL